MPFKISIESIQKSFRNNPYPFLIIFSFLIWVYCFRLFIFNQVRLIEDALSYYDHYKYFIEHIQRGVYPMWDPHMSQGFPSEFFMRRIGSYNPLNFLILLFSSLGMPFVNAYLLFLATYFFVGMTGFYLVVKETFDDRLTGFVAYLLLLFTTLGSRFFDSYFLLIFIPLPWFFYFLLKFIKSPQKHSLVGLIFVLMIFATTYVPFYFLTILLVFLIVLTLFYFKSLPEAIKRIGHFFQLNRILTSLCVGALILSLIPGYLFYKDGKSGEIVLPARSVTTEKGVNAIQVGYKVTQQWAIEEDVAFSGYFPYRDIKFAVLYVPCFVYLMFLLGLILNLEKRMIALFVWGLLLYLICSPNAPIYKFLFDHVFFFKYFRNLHFFLWIFLLPVAMVFLARQFVNFLRINNLSIAQRNALIGYLAAIDLILLYYFNRQGDVVVGTYISLGLSFLFFLWYFLKSNKPKELSVVFLLGIILMIAAEPVQVLSYLSQNSTSNNDKYAYDYDYIKYSIPTIESKNKILQEQKEILAHPLNMLLVDKPPALYYGSRWIDLLNRKMDGNALNHHLRSDFLLFDHLKRIEDEEANLNLIAISFNENRNVAFVAPNYPKEVDDSGFSDQSPLFEFVSQDSTELKVLEVDTNSIKVKTNLKHRRFLVYNENFNSGWEVFINGKKTELYRSNVSFIGVWVPSGENVVVFRFGPSWRYCLNWFMLGLFWIMLIGLIKCMIKERFVQKC